ncbi:MAG: group I intron-associated PD-(D/E)XK endonuclease [Terriglobales bacterium]
MTMEIEQALGISIFAVAEWLREVHPHGTRKWAGEQAEAAFLNKATSLGLSVCKPWGDSERYDLIVGSGSRLSRVQVKSTQYEYLEKNRYGICNHRHGTFYTEEAIDFLAVYIVPLNVWYIIPVKACLNHRNLRFYPGSTNSRGRYEKYHEAWWRLESRNSASPR